jgi:hypothetical protein
MAQKAAVLAFNIQESMLTTNLITTFNEVTTSPYHSFDSTVLRPCTHCPHYTFVDGLQPIGNPANKMRKCVIPIPVVQTRLTPRCSAIVTPKTVQEPHGDKYWNEAVNAPAAAFTDSRLRRSPSEFDCETDFTAFADSKDQVF